MENVNNSPIFDENISTYKHLLDTLRKEDSGKIIRNDSIVHAEVLVENLLTHANKQILIYSSSFCEEFYSKETIMNSLTVAAKNKVSIFLLLFSNLSAENQENSKQRAFIKSFIKETNANVKILSNEEDLKIEDIKLNNFIVVDGKAFRYEKEPPSKTECYNGIKKTMAIGSLNDHEVGGELASAFNFAFSRAKNF